MENEMSFDEWSDKFIAEALAMGYDGPIDINSFQSEYENGEEPESSAQSFVKEMNGL